MWEGAQSGPGLCLRTAQFLAGCPCSLPGSSRGGAGVSLGIPCWQVPVPAVPRAGRVPGEGRLCPQLAVLSPVWFGRPAAQKAERGRGAGAGPAAVPGLLLHLPGCPGAADRLHPERGRRTHRWLRLLSHRRAPHAGREAGVLHGAAQEAATHGGCQQGPAAASWYGDRREEWHCWVLLSLGRAA